LASGAVYAYVGTRIAQRRVQREAQLPLVAFATWWHALAGVTLLAAVCAALAAFGQLDHDLFVAVSYGNLFLIALALAGLVYYLLYLYSGIRRWWKLLVPVYYAYAIFLVYFVRAHRPSGYEVRRWGLAIAYEIPVERDPLFLAVLLLLVLPPILAALAYLSLLRHASGRTLRYRIAIVSTALLLWFGSTLAASVSGLSQSDTWQLASRCIGLGATLSILAAYYPPAWLRRRLGVVSIEEPLPDAPRAG
jgi:hypothetical protein